MLTKEKLKELPKHRVFATGTATDNHTGLNMSGSNELLRWVAVTGEIGDWAIYCHHAYKSEEWIKRFGDKVCREHNIKLCVPCDDEAFKMYRY